MNLKTGFKSLGACIAAAAIAILLATITSAETVATVNGADIDDSVFNVYLESRLQKPAADATVEDRARSPWAP